MTTIDAQEFTLTLDGTALTMLAQGTITLDDSWAPFVQASGISVVTPADSTVLDPRELPQVVLTVRQRFGDGIQFTSDLTTLFAGGTSATITALWAGLLTSALTNLIGSWNGTRIAATSLEAALYITKAVHRDDGTTELELAGGEHLPQQLRSSFRLVPVIPLGAPVEWGVVTIRDVFPYMIPGTLVMGELDAVIPTASLAGIFGVPPATWEQDQWSSMQGFATQADLRLWCGPDGVYRLTPRWESVPGTVVLDDVISASETIDRNDDSWADGVIVEYEPNPDLPDMPSVVGAGSSSTKVAVVKLNIVTPFDGVYEGGSAAPGILARMIERGRSLEITHVNRFDTAPNMAVTIDQPALGWLPASTGVVDAVTFDLETKRMRVTVRELQEV